MRNVCRRSWVVGAQKKVINLVPAGNVLFLLQLLTGPEVSSFFGGQTSINTIWDRYSMHALHRQSTESFKMYGAH